MHFSEDEWEQGTCSADAYARQSCLFAAIIGVVAAVLSGAAIWALL